VVGAVGGVGEEELESGLVAAVPVQLSGDLTGLARTLVGDLRLLVGLRAQALGTLGLLEVGLLSGVELVAGGAGCGLGSGGALFERADELLDAGDLRGLGRLTGPGALHVVPARVVGGERALRRPGDT